MDARRSRLGHLDWTPAAQGQADPTETDDHQ
jgi:hypothetical protein